MLHKRANSQKFLQNSTNTKQTPPQREQRQFRISNNSFKSSHSRTSTNATQETQEMKESLFNDATPKQLKQAQQSYIQRLQTNLNMLNVLKRAMEEEVNKQELNMQDEQKINSCHKQLLQIKRDENAFENEMYKLNSLMGGINNFQLDQGVFEQCAFQIEIALDTKSECVHVDQDTMLQSYFKDMEAKEMENISIVNQSTKLVYCDKINNSSISIPKAPIIPQVLEFDEYLFQINMSEQI